MVRTVRVPRSAGEVTAEWVRSSLGQETSGGRDVTVERVGEGYGLSSELLRVRLCPDADPASVVVKLWSTTIPPGAREARVLEAFGTRLGPRVPQCYLAAVDDEAERAVLLLEDLSGVEQGDCLEDLRVDTAERLARSLAVLHGTWWREEAALAADWLPPAPWLSLEHDWFERRRGRLLERFPDRLGSSARGVLERAEDLYADAVKRLAAAPATLLHDDVHLDNVVFDRASGEPILLDWARTATGPAALDLAEVLFALADPADAERVTAAHAAALRWQGVPEAETADLDGDIAAAMVVGFVKHTCGVAAWEPASPRERLMIERSLDRAQRWAPRV